MSSLDDRPLAAVGHVSMTARPVEPAVRRLEEIGVRTIVAREDFAVMELRGGTHIVVRQSENENVTDTPFDLMYDDIDAAHQLLAGKGFEVTEIERGKIHDSFFALAPEKFRLRVNSSHASDRPV